MATSDTTDLALAKRPLPIALFIGPVVAWLATIKVVGMLVDDRANLDDGRILTSSQIFWALIVPLGIGCLLIYGAITYFGAWPAVFHEPHRVKRWVWIIPAVFALTILAGINYGGLADRGLGFTVTLALAMLLVGFGEEGLFRVLSLVSLRQHGLTEKQVALWSSVLFGAAHIANLIGGDAKALGQALIVSTAGYFFYLIRRVSGANILNSVLHAGFDFTIISGIQTVALDEDPYIGAGLAILTYLVCGVILIAGRNHIELDKGAAVSA